MNFASFTFQVLEHIAMLFNGLESLSVFYCSVLTYIMKSCLYCCQ